MGIRRSKRVSYSARLGVATCSRKVGCRSASMICSMGDPGWGTGNAAGTSGSVCFGSVTRTRPPRQSPSFLAVPWAMVTPSGATAIISPSAVASVKRRLPGATP
ncbi:MAG: hypothetical protein BWY76_01654 [bacterium ADurb.Bin429]|nr:MAG: hypothetical protein BWY76_01654 [bacterium ADurb.Bin429]